MKFDTPAVTNPIDQLKVVGRPTDRVEGPLKTTGRAPYAYERHDVVKDPAYGYIVGAAGSFLVGGILFALGFVAAGIALARAH